MKKIELRESKTLLQVRKIKEEMACEAEKAPNTISDSTAWGRSCSNPLARGRIRRRSSRGDEIEMATRLETAIARVIKEGKVRTYDMGGKDFTLDVAKAIADYPG